MSGKASREIFISYSQIAVFNSKIERPFSIWTKRHINQGFAWRAESVCFKTLEEDGVHLLEIGQKTKNKKIMNEASTIIEVPFEVNNESTTEIGSISSAIQCNIDSGFYQLRYEYYRLTENTLPTIVLIFLKSDAAHFRIIKSENNFIGDTELLLTAEPA